MPTALQIITNKSSKKPDEKLNIMTFCTHERYETGLAKTGHEFWAWQGPGIKTWNSRYAPIPSNYHVLDGNKGDSQLPLWVDIDVVLSQNKFAQYEIAKVISNQLQCPLITLEHTLPPPNMGGGYRKYANSMRGNIDVFISEYSINQWGWDSSKVEVVHHGVDSDLFSPSLKIKREDLVCSVVNDWMNRDWCCGFKIWQEITGWPNSSLPLNVWGDSPGLSSSAPDVPSLVKEYQRSTIFLNTSLISPVPTVLLEAMSAGCAIVSTDTCMIPEFITHGENGFLGKTASELRYYVDLLRKDDSLRQKMGDAARATILQKFSLSNFVNNWNNVFRKIS